MGVLSTRPYREAEALRHMALSVGDMVRDHPSREEITETRSIEYPDGASTYFTISVSRSDPAVEYKGEVE